MRGSTCTRQMNVCAAVHVLGNCMCVRQYMYYATDFLIVERQFVENNCYY
jgi:hypothetical protein